MANDLTEKLKEVQKMKVRISEIIGQNSELERIITNLHSNSSDCSDDRFTCKICCTGNFTSAIMHEGCGNWTCTKCDEKRAKTESNECFYCRKNDGKMIVLRL